jgi:hypothetical protein
MWLYVNGTLRASGAYNFPGTRFSALPSESVIIGSEDNLSSGFFNGTIDELRVSHTFRSAAWVKLSYENQKTTNSLTRLEQ